MEDLIEYNKEQQIKHRMSLCKANPSMCVVPFNDYKHWDLYFSQNESAAQFSKGKARLESFAHLFQSSPVLFFSKPVVPSNPTEADMLKRLMSTLSTCKREYYYYILASLIVLFQVFSDRNHTTANYFYTHMTGYNMTLTMKKGIDELLSRVDYENVRRRPIPEMTSIVDRLIGFGSGGGRRRRKLR